MHQSSIFSRVFTFAYWLAVTLIEQCRLSLWTLCDSIWRRKKLGLHEPVGWHNDSSCSLRVGRERLPWGRQQRGGRTRVAAELQADNSDAFGPYLRSSISAVMIYPEFSPQSPLWNAQIPFSGGPHFRASPRGRNASKVSTMCVW